MRLVKSLVDSVAYANVSAAELLRTTPLDPDSLESLDTRVPLSTFYRLIERALELTGDPAFGLHWMERLPADAFDPIASLVLHAATWQDALRSIIEFRSLLADDAGFRVQERDGKTFLHSVSVHTPSLPVRRFMAEVRFAGFFRAIRRFRAEMHVESISFDYPIPEYADEYARVFDGLARFEQPSAGLLFDQNLMRVPAPSPDAELHEALRVFARRRLVSLTVQQSCARRVYQALAWQNPPRDTSMSSVAGALGLSVRTLRRRLQAEGRSYTDVLNESLATIAKTCLREEQLSIKKTAEKLGFSDNTGFHRAFKRWTGLTPLEYQRQCSDVTDM